MVNLGVDMQVAHFYGPLQVWQLVSVQAKHDPADKENLEAVEQVTQILAAEHMSQLVSTHSLHLSSVYIVYRWALVQVWHTW